MDGRAGRWARAGVAGVDGGAMPHGGGPTRGRQAEGGWARAAVGRGAQAAAGRWTPAAEGRASRPAGEGSPLHLLRGRLRCRGDHGLVGGAAASTGGASCAGGSSARRAAPRAARRRRGRRRLGSRGRRGRLDPGGLAGPRRPPLLALEPRGLALLGSPLLSHRTPPPHGIPSPDRTPHPRTLAILFGGVEVNRHCSRPASSRAATRPRASPRSRSPPSRASRVVNRSSYSSTGHRQYPLERLGKPSRLARLRRILRPTATTAGRRPRVRPRARPQLTQPRQARLRPRPEHRFDRRREYARRVADRASAASTAVVERQHP